MRLFSNPKLLNSQRWKNLRIGLLGGSFNPPHEGHVYITNAAMQSFHLDAVWWLVTPQNPMKVFAPLPLDERVMLSEKLVAHPKVLISTIETDLGTAITYHTVKKLKACFPKTHFLWISGMDNAQSMHKWNHWNLLINEICMVFLTRNPARHLVKNFPLKMQRNQRHIYLHKGGQYPIEPRYTYWMMQKKMIDVSSTDIRNNAYKSE